MPISLLFIIFDVLINAHDKTQKTDLFQLIFFAPVPAMVKKVTPPRSASRQYISILSTGFSSIQLSLR